MSGKTKSGSFLRGKGGSLLRLERKTKSDGLSLQGLERKERRRSNPISLLTPKDKQDIQSSIRIPADSTSNHPSNPKILKEGDTVILASKNKCIKFPRTGMALSDGRYAIKSSTNPDFHLWVRNEQIHGYADLLILKGVSVEARYPSIYMKVFKIENDNNFAILGIEGKEGNLVSLVKVDDNWVLRDFDELFDFTIVDFND